MTKDEFAQRILAMTDVLYRIAWSQLRWPPDRGRRMQHPHEGTVKSRLSRGRDKLKNLLNEEVFES